MFKLMRTAVILCLFVCIVSNAFANVRFPFCLTATNVSGGEDHTLVLTEDGTLWGCGLNDDYQLGNDDNQQRLLLAQVLSGDQDAGAETFLQDVKDIAAGMAAFAGDSRYQQRLGVGK